MNLLLDAPKTDCRWKRQLLGDGEAPDGGVGGEGGGHLVFDVVGEDRFFAELGEVFFDFLQFALEDQFDGAVGEGFATVPDRSKPLARSLQE